MHMHITCTRTSHASVYPWFKRGSTTVRARLTQTLPLTKVPRADAAAPLELLVGVQTTEAVRARVRGRGRGRGRGRV